MDFLDPKKRRRHQTKLWFTYTAMAAIITIGTVILVNIAYGNSFNTKTGTITQRGLLFLDSKPADTQIYLNGERHKELTPARLVLSEGTYEVELKKDGYRNWKRTIIVDGHSVARYIYPRLVPATLKAEVVKKYSSTPGFISQSPDKRWLLIQQPKTTDLSYSFDLYDTRSLQMQPQQFELPTDLLSVSGAKTARLTPTEWSSDSQQLLLRHDYQDGSEFILLDRRSPDQSINLNERFKVSGVTFSLRNKKIDQFYLFHPKNQTLRVADLDSSSLGPVFLQNVAVYVSQGEDLIEYVAEDDKVPAHATIKIWENGDSYNLYLLDATKQYLLGFTFFKDHWLYLAGGGKLAKPYLFSDPLTSLKKPGVAKALPLLALSVTGATRSSISENSRFIAAQAGQSMSVYDGETEEEHFYTINNPLSGSLQWLDGHHLIGESQGRILLMDYDGVNQQMLVPSVNSKSAFLSFDQNHLLVLSSVKNTETALDVVDLRAGVDLE